MVTRDNFDSSGIHSLYQIPAQIKIQIAIARPKYNHVAAIINTHSINITNHIPKDIRNTINESNLETSNIFFMTLSHKV